MQQLPQERLSIAVQAQASAQRAFDEAVKFTSDRKAFGKRILDFQNTRFTLADLQSKLQVGWAHLDWAIARHVAGKLTAAEASAAGLDPARDPIPGLRRDVLFTCTADEEAGGQAGAAWIVEHRPEWLAAAGAINESGAVSTTVGGVRFYPIGVAEKGYAAYRIHVKGTWGHGSMPREDNAVVLAAAVIASLADPEPTRLTPVMTRFLDIAAGELPLAADHRQAGLDVDGLRGIGIGAGSVVHPHRRLAARGLEHDLAHRDAKRADVDLAAAADGPGGDADFGAGWDVGHVVSPKNGERAVLWRTPLPPSAGVNRIRFSGSKAPAFLSSADWRSPGDDGSIGASQAASK